MIRTFSFEDHWMVLDGLRARLFLIAFFLPMVAHTTIESPIDKEGLNQRSGFIENKGQIVDQNNKPNPAVLFYN